MVCLVLDFEIMVFDIFYWMIVWLSYFEGHLLGLEAKKARTLILILL